MLLFATLELSVYAIRMPCPLFFISSPFIVMSVEFTSARYPMLGKVDEFTTRLLWLIK